MVVLREKRLNILISNEELRMLQELADSHQITSSDWVRRQIADSYEAMVREVADRCQEIILSAKSKNLKFVRVNPSQRNILLNYGGVYVEKGPFEALDFVLGALGKKVKSKKK